MFEADVVFHDLSEKLPSRSAAMPRLAPMTTQPTANVRFVIAIGSLRPASWVVPQWNATGRERLSVIVLFQFLQSLRDSFIERQRNCQPTAY
jgi:hypothetical protein